MPEITMPKLSDTMTEGTLLRWCKKKGDTVEIGDLLAEVETDKATMEMEAFEEGILTDTYIEEGGKIAVGAPIARIKAEGESDEPTPIPAASTASAATNIESSAAASAPKESSSPKSPGSRVGRPAIPGGTPDLSSVCIKASPLAKKIAREHHLSLEKLTLELGSGSGPGGRIVAADVLAAAGHFSGVGGAGSAAGVAPVAVSPAIPLIEGAAIEGNPHIEVPLTGMRRTIAQRLLASKTQIPHFYLAMEIDATPMMSLRKELVQEHAEGRMKTKVTFNDLVVLAAARAAAEHPNINASFSAEGIYQYQEVNMAVAIAVEDGLVTPVLRNAAASSLEEISLGIKDFAVRARSKKLKPEEFAGGTITVSNLGAYKIDQFFAIVNPPQAVIIAVGGITKKPVVTEENHIIVGHRMNLALSGDHRVVDGATAALYLNKLKELLESPSQLLLA